MTGKRWVIGLVLGFCPTWAWSQPLSESDLFFNPDLISPDYYARHSLDDLNLGRTVVWNRNGDPVVGAWILPFLNRSDYPLGYVFSNDDYQQRPSLGNYGASLFDGDLVASFNTPGIYHVRVFRQSGQTKTEAVFAECGFVEKDGQPNRSGAMGDEPNLEPADLFLCDAPDMPTQKLKHVFGSRGNAMTDVTSRQDAYQKIKDYSRFSGRKLHVELLGHGVPGGISTGAGREDIPDEQVDMDSVRSFCESLVPYVKKMTFQGCSVAEGDKGRNFLNIVGGYFGSAGAYTGTISSEDGIHVKKEIGSEYIVVPEPAGIVPLLVGLAGLAWICRRRQT